MGVQDCAHGARSGAGRRKPVKKAALNSAA
jgi:hypothetical protein